MDPQRKGAEGRDFSTSVEMTATTRDFSASVEMTATTIVDFALQADRLDMLPRTGWQMRGVARPETVAAHCFGTALWTMLLADETPGVDADKALRMALLHELGETKLSDIPKIAESYLPPGAKDDAERRIAAELLEPLGARGAACLALVVEFQAGATVEAKLVRAADKLHMMMKALRYELDGNRGVAEFWSYEPNFPDYGLPLVRELFAALRARRP